MWVQLTFEHYEHVIAATSGLRSAAELERIRGHHHMADEYDRLADQLTWVLNEMTAAYRESHPPGEQKTVGVEATDADRGDPPQFRTQEVSSRIVTDTP